MLRSVFNRIFEDYLMSSRLVEYESLIKASLDQGYEFVKLNEFHDLAIDNKLQNKKYFVLRHDIDTDLHTARKMFKIEKKYSIKSSYYFRLSTLDYKLMKEIHRYGSEASYHFEEIASYCKEHGIKSQAKMLENIENIRLNFIENFINIEKELGYKLETVVSHGDFVNRKLGITNSILIDSRVRNKLNIKSEGYDDIYLKNYTVIISDTSYPDFYQPVSPFEALKENPSVLYLLVHPRHWNKNIVANTIENFKRVFEGLKYRFN